MVKASILPQVRKQVTRTRAHPCTSLVLPKWATVLAEGAAGIRHVLWQTSDVYPLAYNSREVADAL
jgi:hypothetical protein